MNESDIDTDYDCDHDDDTVTVGVEQAAWYTKVFDMKLALSSEKTKRMGLALEIKKVELQIRQLELQ